MPSRPVILAILLFWACSIGWLLYREVWPFLGVGSAPAYTIDITEQIGPRPVRWIVYYEGKKVGGGTTQVQRAENRGFDIQSDFKLDHFSIFALSIHRIAGTYTVTEDGALRSLHGEVTGDLGPPQSPPNPAGKMVFKAVIEEGFLIPEFHAYYLGAEIAPIPMDKAPVSEHGNLLNPMQPLNRLSGLRPGQRWRVPLFNPLSALVNQMGKQLPGGLPAANETLRLLQAEVVADDLDWNDETIPCYKIEYREPGKSTDVAARTYVRRYDGLVLRQDANYAGSSLALVRLHEK